MNDRRETDLVLLHGFLGGPEDFDPLIRALGDAARCHAVHLPGHGDTAPPAIGRGNAFFAVVDFMAALIRERVPVPANVLGYSMGGRVTWGLVVKHPHLVRRAVVIGAHPGLRTSEERRARGEQDRALARRLTTEGLAAFLDSWYRNELFRTLRAHAAFGALMERRKAGDASALAEALLALTLGNQPGLWDDLVGTRVPVLALAGRSDEKYRRLNATLGASCPSISTADVEGAGHAAHIEAPESVARLVAAFINDPEAEWPSTGRT